MPNLYVIGGANGSGKTTVALTVLPRFLQIFEYVNADANDFVALALRSRIVPAESRVDGDAIWAVDAGTIANPGRRRS
jgi:uridine kinase